jgi:hypothetical protein
MDIHIVLFSFFSASNPSGGMQNGHSSFPDKFRNAHIGGLRRDLPDDLG